MVTRTTVCSNRWRGAILFSLSAALAGCGTLPDDYGPTEGPAPMRTDDEQRLHQQGQVFNNTVTEGCVVGAALGAVLGSVLAPSDRRGRYAAVGALAGGALGCGSGAWLARTQQQHAISEQQLDAMITEVRGQNAKLSQLLVTSRRVIAEDKRKIERIDRELAAGRLSRDRARAEMTSVDSNQQYLENTLANLKKEQVNWERTAARVRGQGNPQKAAEMDREVNRLEQQLSSLETELDSLVKRRRVSRVG